MVINPIVELDKFYKTSPKKNKHQGTLVGGWTTHLKNMLVKLEIFPKVRGEK